MNKTKKKILTPKWSGDESHKFWQMVKKIKDENLHDTIYTLGVILQNVESDILRKIEIHIDESENDSNIKEGIK